MKSDSSKRSLDVCAHNFFLMQAEYFKFAVPLYQNDYVIMCWSVMEEQLRGFSLVEVSMLQYKYI